MSNKKSYVGFHLYFSKTNEKKMQYFETNLFNFTQFQDMLKIMNCENVKKYYVYRSSEIGGKKSKIGNFTKQEEKEMIQHICSIIHTSSITPTLYFHIHNN